MNVWRLDPIPHRLNDLRWQASSYKSGVWAGAASPDDARDLVARKSVSSMTPRGVYEPKPISPWYDSNLVSCVADKPQIEVPLGTVIKFDGEAL